MANDDFDQFDDSSENEKGFGGFSDLLKKVVVTGASAVFLTEDALKAMIKEFKLPKELISTILSSAKSTKEEFVEKVTAEFSRQISKVDIRQEMVKFLESHEMDINLKLKFSPKSQKIEKDS